MELKLEAAEKFSESRQLYSDFFREDSSEVEMLESPDAKADSGLDKKQHNLVKEENKLEQIKWVFQPNLNSGHCFFQLLVFIISSLDQ